MVVGGDVPGPAVSGDTGTATLSRMSDSLEGRSRSDRMLSLIDDAAFPMARRSGAGYVCADVTTFLEETAARIRAGESILGSVRTVRFKMAPRNTPGYHVGAVDGFLDELEEFAHGEAAAAGGAATGSPAGGVNWLAIVRRFGVILLLTLVVSGIWYLS